MTKCLNCIYYAEYPECRCKLKVPTVNIKWEQMSVESKCEHFKDKILRYKESCHQQPKECNINQIRFGSD